MSKVSDGHGYEREVKKLWEDAGYMVTRSAASSGTFDLIATKIENGVQKKTYYIVLMQQKWHKLHVCPKCDTAYVDKRGLKKHVCKERIE